MDTEREELSRCLLVPDYHIHGDIENGWLAAYINLRVACKLGLPWLFEMTVRTHFPNGVAYEYKNPASGLHG